MINKKKRPGSPAALLLQFLVCGFDPLGFVLQSRSSSTAAFHFPVTDEVGKIEFHLPAFPITTGHHRQAAEIIFSRPTLAFENISDTHFQIAPVPE
jgi:hypothetical protein